MILNNENKKLSRNKNRRNDSRNKITNDMKILLNKIKPEKKKKEKDINKIKKK